MPRISDAARKAYKLLIREGSTEEQCYYCGELAGMEDFTPATTVSEADRARFTEEMTRCKTCHKCWKRIYTVNIAERGVKFNTGRGMMTVRQKEAICGSSTTSTSIEDLATKIGFGFEPKMLAPIGMMQMDANRFIWREQIFYIDEVLALQGALALKMVGGNDDHVWALILDSLSTGNTDGSKLGLYVDMVGISREGRVAE